MSDRFVVHRGHGKRVYHQPHSDSTEGDAVPACSARKKWSRWREVDEHGLPLSVEPCKNVGCFGKETRFNVPVGDHE